MHVYITSTNVISGLVTDTSFKCFRTYPPKLKLRPLTVRVKQSFSKKTELNWYSLPVTRDISRWVQSIWIMCTRKAIILKNWAEWMLIVSHTRYISLGTLYMIYVYSYSNLHVDWYAVHKTCSTQCLVLINTFHEYWLFTRY